MSTSPSPSPAGSAPGLARRRLSSEDRRSQLIANAIEMFSRHGFSGTRTRDIAAACGVSEGILFRHFATKEDLYRAILELHANEAGSHEWMRSIKRLAAARDDRAVIHELTSHILKSFRENAAFHRLMFYAWLEGHALADMAHQQFGLPLFDFLRKYVILRQREGAFRDGDTGALVIAMYAPALQHAMNKHLFGMDLCQTDDQTVADQLAGLALSSVKNRKTKKT
jgi:TetR/AcrR family transcriptional regulator